MARRVVAPRLVVVLILCSTAGLAAQQIFRGGTDTVLLSVSTSDAHNHPVTTLQQSNFQVFEDGFLQDITVFSKDPQPIALSILIDSSTSMEGRLSIATEAASGFCRRLGPKDTAQIIAFNSDVQILQPFTSDFDALEHAIRGARASGSTSLYTALYVALNELERVRRAQNQDEVHRQAIIVLSDGEDNTSLLTYDDVLDLTKRSGVAVYAIWLREKPSSVAAPAIRAGGGAEFVLRSLSQTTGGRMFVVDDALDLPAIYGQIADELANQYTIGYVSKNTAADGAWRQVAVRVSPPGVVARTKAGYFGPRKDP
jgi:Ca-activated chloride channel homolog